MPKGIIRPAAHAKWREDEVVTLRVVQAHRDRAVLRRGHKATCVDTLLFQRTGVHEIVNKEGQLVHAPARDDKVGFRFPKLSTSPRQHAGPQTWADQETDKEADDRIGLASAVKAALGGRFQHSLEEPDIVQGITGAAIGDKSHCIAIAPGMPDMGGVEGDRRSCAAFYPLLDRLHRNGFAAMCPTPGVGLKLEGCKADNIAVPDEEGDDVRNLVEIIVGHR